MRQNTPWMGHQSVAGQCAHSLSSVGEFKVPGPPTVLLGFCFGTGVSMDPDFFTGTLTSARKGFQSNREAHALMFTSKGNLDLFFFLSREPRGNTSSPESTLCSGSGQERWRREVGTPLSAPSHHCWPLTSRSC